MRDLILFIHVILGFSLVALPIVILLNKRSSWLKPLSVMTAAASWILLIFAGKLYITFYPATKTLIKAGSKPWLHSIVMETKEHWGILLPIIATVAAGLVLSNRYEKSRRWWILLIILSALIGILGRFITGGAA